MVPSLAPRKDGRLRTSSTPLPQASPSDRWPYRVVADTNVFLAGLLPSKKLDAQKNGFRKPPGRDFLERAFHSEFVLLVSTGTFFELIEKLEELQVPEELVLELTAFLRDDAEEVSPTSFDRFCDDVDDDKFIHTALAGDATHLVSHDGKLRKAVEVHNFSFRFREIIAFLREIRSALKELLAASGKKSQG